MQELVDWNGQPLCKVLPRRHRIRRWVAEVLRLPGSVRNPVRLFAVDRGAGAYYFEPHVELKPWTTYIIHCEREGRMGFTTGGFKECRLEKFEITRRQAQRAS